MRSVLCLELADGRALVAAAHQEASRRGATVSVAVVDAGGHPLLLERPDGASPASGAAALAKARMAALNGKPTADLEAAINGQRPALQQLAGALGEPVAAMAGGIPLLREGLCLGAIGVSGMTPDVDTAIALAALAALPSP
jgi:glc operon protein GlcG